MSLKMLSLDGKVIAEIKTLIEGLSKVFDVNIAFETALRLLEGRDDVYELVEQMKPSKDAETIKSLIKALSIFLWDCGRNISGTSRDLSTAMLEELLLQNGVNSAFAAAFTQFIGAQRSRLIDVKRSLEISTPSYHDLVWRLDVELSRRNLTVMTEPKFQLRLDLTSSSSSTSDPQLNAFQHPHQSSDQGKIHDMFISKTALSQGSSDVLTSLHLQADYANMKNLQLELQRGLNELQGVHGQRLTRYIA